VLQHIRGEEKMDPLNVSTPPGTTDGLRLSS